MWRSLFLPPEQSQFERDHLKKVNRIALAFFALHVPLMAAVAAANHTGPLQAVVMTLLVLIGPAVAWAALPNARHVSVVMGVAAMCMGGLLVHFGQGPMQIEMHFYFFSLLAVLALFANPMVIVAAAVTVTLHHTVVWALWPTSVFNYEASIGVVAVHASFVVVESLAAIYLARSFFDSVIGMEKIVEQRTDDLRLANRSMRLVLQHVNQGLLTVDRGGKLAHERSAMVDQLLGPAPPTMHIEDYLRNVDPAVAEWFSLGWEDLISGIMPVEVTLDQLPRQLSNGERHMSVSYIPIPDDGAPSDGSGGNFSRVLMVFSDDTAEIRTREVEAQREQQMTLFAQFRRDPAGLRSFVNDIDHLLGQLRTEQDLVVSKRVLHTVKGNVLSMGLKGFGAVAHQLEDKLAEEARTPSTAELDALDAAWRELRDAAESFLSGGHSDAVMVSAERVQQLEMAVACSESSEEVVTLVRELTWRPASQRLSSLAQQAAALAERLEKPVQVSVDGGGVFLAPGELDELWSQLVHVVRNAIDHGLDDVDAREALGKSPTGKVGLRCFDGHGELLIEVSDDGRGVNWTAVAEKARSLGLPADTRADLEAALFADGLSTAAQISDTSGRGVGMSALLATVQALGGSVSLQTEANEGTTWSIRVPRLQAVAA